MLGAEDTSVLEHVADGVFDGAVDHRRTAEFLSDARHHLVVAIDSGDGDRDGGRGGGRGGGGGHRGVDEGVVVGMASAVHYVHPDKGPELWVNEVGVAPSHRRRGIARILLNALSKHGRSLGCEAAWVLTERRNGPAMSLYASLGAREETENVVLFSWELPDPE
jgi:ribosomal protein S18 acetylase RimI-like enzyme